MYNAPNYRVRAVQKGVRSGRITPEGTGGINFNMGDGPGGKVEGVRRRCRKRKMNRGQ